MQSPLRIVALVNSGPLPHWQTNLLGRLADDPCCSLLALVVRGDAIRKDAEAEPATCATPDSLATRLFYRYQRWDRQRFLNTPDALSPGTLSPRLQASLKVLNCQPRTTGWCDYFSDADIERINALQPDIVLRLGWRILKGDILALAAGGLWSFHHGDNRSNRGGPPAIWENYYGQAVTGLTLQVLSDKIDDGAVLARSFTATDTASPARTRNRLYWRSADILLRELRQCHRLGIDAYRQRARQAHGALTTYSLPLLSERKLNLWQCTRLLAGNLKGIVRTALRERLKAETWQLHFQLGDAPGTAPWRFKTIASPAGYYWADPHVASNNGIHHVFVEEFDEQRQKGQIARLSIDAATGAVSEQAETVIDTDYHLSYPHVFQHRGRWYMVPESGERRRIELWRCTDFPSVWQRDAILMDDVWAVDTTLHWQDGLWWMFTTLREAFSECTHDQLSLFWSDSLSSGNWTPHPGNPIVSDVRSARCAGRLFEHQGELYRPAQDGSVEYGYATTLFKVSTLNQKDYAEKEAGRLEPLWTAGLAGTHTYSHVPGITIIDSKRRRWSVSRDSAETQRQTRMERASGRNKVD